MSLSRLLGLLLLLATGTTFARPATVPLPTHLLDGGMDVAMNANAVAVERRLSRAVMSSSHGFWSLGGFAGGALGGLLLGLLILLIAVAMYLRMDTIGGMPMPMLSIATQISPWLGHLMSLVIFGMILNTAVGMLYAFMARIVPAETGKFRVGTVVAGVLALAGSFVGFIKLVGIVYPIYGYIGFVLMALAFVGWLRVARRQDAAA